ncbi:small ribosomal subunit protein mS35-like [Ornithodoros turicata]|uniref:small ribosomal subunit protein mS35-like n=1 Tax=Ornithodoros turicata TaxID=34597 RepID=UPI003139A17B
MAASCRDVFWKIHCVSKCSNFSVQRTMSSFLSAKSTTTEPAEEADGEFRKLDLYKRREVRKKSKPRELQVNVPAPRYTRMPIDQDWTSVWPTAQSFRPSVVPLPIRQGYSKKGAPPGKFVNLELMKIPNFLHLTPPHIEKHCEALKKFCTQWPAGLETDEQCAKHFPIEVTTSDYCHSSPTIRDVRSRIVTLKVKLSKLNLDYHARDKLLRLVGDRYDSSSDTLTIVTDRCPLRKQNYDYAHYLLAALYHECWTTEPWESEKAESDMECFIWEGSRSEKNLVDTVDRVKQALKGKETFNLPHIQQLPDECPTSKVKVMPEVRRYGEALTAVYNEGENEYTWENYKRSVYALLRLGEAPETVQGEVEQGQA